MFASPVALMHKGRIVIISGPSGSGKTTLHKKLLQDRRLKKKLIKAISVTTRPRRKGEKQGRDYFFMDKREFLERRRKRYFLEWQKVFDYYYGTPKEEVQRILKKGKNVLLCIEVKGARVVSRRCPSALKIFIMPPSMEVLKQRLRKRKSETLKSLMRRLQVARREMKEASSYHHIVVNDTLTNALKCLKSIVYSISI